MAFVIKQITARTTGGTITRTHRHDAGEVLIGRGVDCDIVLEDLAVRLRHASIHQLPGGRVTVAALDRAAVAVDGKLIDGEVDLLVSEAPVLTIGGQKLTLTPAETGDNVAILVEQLGEAAAPREEREVFQLGQSLPGRRIMAWASVLVVLAVFLIWPILGMDSVRGPKVAGATPATAMATAQAASFHPDESWSSGPLSPPHAFLSKDCGACHTKAFSAVRDDQCLACHAGKQPGQSPFAALKDHADPKRLAAVHPDVPGFAAGLRKAVGPAFNLPDWSCTGCHREHEGAVTTPASTDQFCAGCHAGMKAVLPDTKLANAPSWDQHPQLKAMITDNSGDQPVIRQVALSDNQLGPAQPPEISGLKFPHDMHVSTTNGVAQMTRRLGARYGWKGDGLGCSDCHTPEAGGVRLSMPTMEKNCAQCHALEFADEGGQLRTLRHGDPRQAIADLRDYLRLAGPQSALVPDRARVGLAFSERAAVRKTDTVRLYPMEQLRTVRGLFEPGGACHDCHIVTPPTNPASFDYRIHSVKFTERYMTRGWFSHSDHNTANMPCSRCHEAAKSKVATNLLIPALANCQSCHAGPHPKGNQVASSCGSCHSYHNGAGAPAYVRKGPKPAPVVAARAIPAGLGS